MSDDCRSISGSPCTIHSATDLPTPGPSFTHTADAAQSPFTSGVSPSSGRPSGVSDSSPLIAYLIPTDSSPSTSGTSCSACSSCSSKSSCVNGSSVGDSDASSMDGISSGSWRIGRCAYEPTSSPCPSWRSYMFVSMSRTIGNSIDVFDERNRGTGPTSIIWCTAGVSGIDAPAMRAMRGLHTPQAMTTYSASTSPRLVRTRFTRPSCTSIPSTSVFANTCSAPDAWPFSRISVPKRSESTTATDGV